MCVERGLAPSRQRAQALIMAGKVLLDDAPATKAGVRVSPRSTLRLLAPDHPYVSRGGLKLEAALDGFGVAVTGEVALDLGASTGGFTDCLLQRGARHVIAVDVGYGQLAWKLRQDPRVTCVERTNARNLTPAELERVVRAAAGDAPGPWPPALCTMDLSFISLTLVLPAAARLLGPRRPVVTLIKPQFEAGREEVGKGGVIRDPAARQQIVDRVLGWARDRGFDIEGSIPSPVHGPKGNIEQLALLVTPADVTTFACS